MPVGYHRENAAEDLDNSDKHIVEFELLDVRALHSKLLKHH